MFQLFGTTGAKCSTYRRAASTYRDCIQIRWDLVTCALGAVSGRNTSCHGSAGLQSSSINRQWFKTFILIYSAHVYLWMSATGNQTDLGPTVHLGLRLVQLHFSTWKICSVCDMICRMVNVAHSDTVILTLTSRSV